MSNADDLIRTLIATSHEPDHGVLANELLAEYRDGHPLETLRPLLASPQTEVVGVAMFVVSELGRKGALLLNDVVKLLEHHDVGVRFDVITSILTCASASDGNKIASVVLLLDDPDYRIRWKAMRFLSLASLEQLRAAVKHFQENQPSLPHIAYLKWVDSDSASNEAEIERMINSSDPLSRKYGVIAATRIVSQATQLLVCGLSSEDTDIQQFAESMLKIISPRK